MCSTCFRFWKSRDASLLLTNETDYLLSLFFFGSLYFVWTFLRLCFLCAGFADWVRRNGWADECCVAFASAFTFALFLGFWVSFFLLCVLRFPAQLTGGGFLLSGFVFQTHVSSRNMESFLHSFGAVLEILCLFYTCGERDRRAYLFAQTEGIAEEEQ